MKSKLSTKALITCFFLLLSLQFGFRATFHGIIVWDSYNSDDAEFNFEKDRYLMEAEFRRIAKHTNMKLNLKVFTNSTASNALITYLNALNVESEDVLFIIYSGFGQNSQLDEFAAFPASGKKIAQTDVHEVIRSKGGRLRISMFLTSNHRMPETISKNDNFIPRKALYQDEQTPVDEVYRILFKNSRGDVKFCSAYNQYALGNSSGSICLNIFLKTMRSFEYLANPVVVNWHEVLRRTREGTRREVASFGREQTPYYQLSLSN